MQGRRRARERQTDRQTRKTEIQRKGRIGRDGRERRRKREKAEGRRERKDGEKGEGREGREKEVTLQFSYTMKARKVTFKKKIKTASQKRIKKKRNKKGTPQSINLSKCFLMKLESLQGGIAQWNSLESQFLATQADCSGAVYLKGSPSKSR